MRIRFYATLRAAAEDKEIQMLIQQPTTIGAALHAVTQDKPKLQEELWDAQGNLRDIVKVFCNGRQVEYLPAGLNTLVSDADELDVFPPVGGGA